MSDTPFEGEVLAPAKINLALHIVGRREDGYHLLESVAVFAARIADRLSIEPAHKDRLVVDGPFAVGVPTDHRNIVHKALDLTREEALRLGLDVPPLLIRLTKALPHGAGIGGGSSDAAALLRKLGSLSPDLAAAQARRCTELGADVPMCMIAKPVIARGIGEELDEIDLGAMPSMVLVNPQRPISTPTVFKALRNRENAPLPPLPQGGFWKTGDLIAWLDGTRNDLQETATAIEPAVGDAVAKLTATGADIVRMSGSGSTVFALYKDEESAQRGAAALARTRPDWWVASA
ncbi:4-(cytidine 5'-diphospho)-2-C-methyl-D-erythritol kinase [Fulvimarina sp. MAC3]|uniref:4-(cytidine 5'-diphospho)-2-C-methyl-D-erythritol kinase n=1 Tax=Fulvimarina sp. MAC3 TaxID=3148887 RepID=UPI0031FD5341